MYGRSHNPPPHHRAPQQTSHQNPFPTHPSPCTDPRNCTNHHNAWTTAMHHMRTLGVRGPDHLAHIWLHHPGSDPHADSTLVMFEAMGRSMAVDEHLGLLPARGMGRGGERGMGFGDEYRGGFDARGGARGRRRDGEAEEYGFGEGGYGFESSDEEEYGRGRGHRGGSRGPPRGGRNDRGGW